ncbi:MAG: UDP-N-acetylmuramate dehydrogenase [Armatimonadetes bacterium]|nr:UDP-N-acetylmuramate dehydrogenase [Armatimonadota bacterium]
MTSLLRLAQPQVSLVPFSTLRAGGSAEWFAEAFEVDTLAELAIYAQRERIQMTTLGTGSNILPSDAGVLGLVVHNATRRLEISDDGEVVADSGVAFQDLFLKTAQIGLSGLEYAVGIPGTIGGALISNAGAYRSNISEFLTEVEVVADAKRQWVFPDWLELSYRDSKLRKPDAPPCSILRLKFKLPTGRQKAIYDEARDYQRQRISKQPAPASAGSFFKNINNRDLADRLETLPEKLKAAGVVPAGYLLEAAGLAGMRHGGAMFSRRHANFMLNVGGASATEIRTLATLAKSVVLHRFGATLEEEVLYLGDWSAFVS